jgi:ammonia channel protein AmtB
MAPIFAASEPGITQAAQGLAGGQGVHFGQFAVSAVVEGARLAHHDQGFGLVLAQMQVFELGQPSIVQSGPLAGLVAVCAGSDLMHPLGALMVGAIAGAIFVVMFTLTQNKWKINDVLGVWPLHGLCSTWGGVAWAAVGGLLVYGVLKATMSLRLSQKEEYDDADLSIHKISSSSDREANW